MTVREIIADLKEAEKSQGCLNPEIYIRIGLHQVKASCVEYCPETDDEEEAIIIS